MEPQRFDSLARSLAAPKSRRSVLAGIGSILGVAIGARSVSATTACPPGQLPNRKGDCSCPPGTDACPSGRFYLRRDTANCGRCGNVCVTGEVCTKGECRCPAGVICCSDRGGPCQGHDDCCGDSFCIEDRCVTVPASTEPAPI